MAFNRIAVYGHRGWVSSAVVEALAASGAPIRVLYRPGSDVSTLPPTPNVTKVEVDLQDQEALVAALEDIDIVIPLVGQQGVPLEHAFVKAIPKTRVKLFVPSDLAFRCDEQGFRITVNKVKDEVEKAAREAGIPTTVILPGLFAESALSAGLAGVDIAGNRIIYTGGSAHLQLNICTKKYVAAAYASIFARNPISEIQNRAIGLSELRITGEEVYNALEKKHGRPPQFIEHSLEKVDQEIEERLRQGTPLALAYYCRKIWGTGYAIEGVGIDIWEVEDFEKASLDNLIVKGQLESYRDVPLHTQEALRATYN